MLLKNSKPKQPTIFGPTIFVYILRCYLFQQPQNPMPTFGSKQHNRWTLAHRAIDVQTTTLEVDLESTFIGAFQCVIPTIEDQRCTKQVVVGSRRGDDTMSARVKGQLCTVAAVAQAIDVAWGERGAFLLQETEIKRGGVGWYLGSSFICIFGFHVSRV